MPIVTNIITMSLSTAEKQELVKYFKDRAEDKTRRNASLTKEKAILKELVDKMPKKASKDFLTALIEKHSAWEKQITTNEKGSLKLIDISVSIEKGEVISVNEDITGYLSELYHRENTRKAVEPKYKYYPRLKKAREVSLNAFANKIKTIMESKNVKIA